VRLYRKKGSQVPLEVALEFLNSPHFYGCLITGSHGFQRSLPRKDALQRIPDIVQFLRSVLVSGRSEDNIETNDALKECYHNGWLQAESVSGNRTVYIFPTKIHQWYEFSIIHNHHYSKLILSLRYAERLLCTAESFPKDRFGSIKDLCFAAVGEFSHVSLSSVERGIGPGAVNRPLEAQYQDEFYRACSELKVYLTSEWSGSSLVGRIDFHIKEVKWVIECVRDGDQIDEHIKRFQQGGRYHKWIMSGEVKDYIILDFRTSKPRKARGMVISFCSSGLMNANWLANILFLYFIVFSNDYTSYQIYDASVNPVGGKIALIR
jgi:hypothetical protein